MGVRKKRVATYVMIVVTVIWAVALYLHIQDYDRYRQEVIEKYLEWGGDEEFANEQDFWPIFDWGSGQLVLQSGVTILCVWLAVLVGTRLLSSRLLTKSKRKEGFSGYCCCFP